MIPFGVQLQPGVWHKSSFCQNSECAEIAVRDGEFLVRSSREPEHVIRLSATEWQALVKGIQAGEFSAG
jgi:hypothetical protein